MKLLTLLGCAFARKSWEQNEETLSHNSLVKFSGGHSVRIRDLLLANEITGGPS
jgi:hypothetical protein